MEYKPGRLNVVADVLLRQPDFEPAAQSDTVALLTSIVSSSTLFDDIRHECDPEMVHLMDHYMHLSPKFLKGLSPAYNFF